MTVLPTNFKTFLPDHQKSSAAGEKIRPLRIFTHLVKNDAFFNDSRCNLFGEKLTKPLENPALIGNVAVLVKN
jgi:hypothetical protein